MDYYRNLEVPYFSQRENKCIWIEKYPLDSKIIDADGKHLAGATVSIEKWGKYFKQTEENYLIVSDDF